MRFDVGGRRLFLESRGEGAPTLVLEPGLFGDSRAWHGVFSDLAAVTRTIRWGRAGFGRSDLGPLPQTSERICADLHALLTAAQVPPPHVLVGHSFGAFTLRLYAARYGQDVAGLIFVEPSMPDFDERVQPVLSSKQWDNLQRDWRPAGHPQFVDFEQSAAGVLAAPPLPEVPVLVLRGLRQRDWLDWPRDAIDRLWHEYAVRLAASVSRGTVVEIEGHDLFIDQPARFVAEVSRFIDELKGTYS